MVRVGPVSDRERASAIAKQLVGGGFLQPTVSIQTGPFFRVVSEPLPRSVAEGLVATLAGRGFHSQVEPLTGDTVQLVFGTFTSQKEAETLSQRIGAQGYDAWVVRVLEGAVYTLQLGPYPLSTVDTITRIIKSSAPDAAVTVDPVPQASPPSPGPSPNVNDRLYMVRVGPVSDRERASAIAKQLVGGGFLPPTVSIQTGPLFRVVSEPLPRSVAEGLVTTLAGRGFHSQVEPLTGDTVQLVFGTFTSQKEAETLSQRIGAQGYDAWVVRVLEGAVYTLQLGPYPLSTVDTITRIIKSSAPDAAVTVDPVP